MGVAVDVAAPTIVPLFGLSCYCSAAAEIMAAVLSLAAAVAAAVAVGMAAARIAASG